MRVYIIFISFLLIYTGCGQKSSDEMYDIAGYNEEMAPATMREMQGPPPQKETVSPVKVSPQKIIKNGNIGLLVNHLEETKRRIDTLVNRYGGYYANENFQNNDYAANIQLKIRIPASLFIIQFL